MGCTICSKYISYADESEHVTYGKVISLIELFIYIIFSTFLHIVISTFLWKLHLLIEVYPHMYNVVLYLHILIDNIQYVILKVGVCEPGGSLYNDIQRVSPMANLFRQLHTVAVLLRMLVNVNLQAHSYITVTVSTCAECFKRKVIHVHIFAKCVCVFTVLSLVK